MADLLIAYGKLSEDFKLRWAALTHAQRTHTATVITELARQGSAPRRLRTMIMEFEAHNANIRPAPERPRRMNHARFLAAIAGNTPGSTQQARPTKEQVKKALA